MTSSQPSAQQNGFQLKGSQRTIPRQRQEDLGHAIWLKIQDAAAGKCWEAPKAKKQQIQNGH